MQEHPLPAQSLPWREPLEAAQAVRADCFVLLYSGVQSGYSGRYSFLALEPLEVIQGDHFGQIAPHIRNDRPWHESAWFGYLGYGLKHDVEKLPADATDGWITCPGLWLTRFATLYRFDHDKRLIERYGPAQAWEHEPSAMPAAHAGIVEIHSPMSKTDYLSHVSSIIDAIHAGKLYQANLTRKFRGSFRAAPDSLHYFQKLCSVSPAPYSAYIKMGKTAILSSSPERFLTIDAQRNIETRPIKGSMGRGKNSEEDARAKRQLQESEKDRAENLMIVDLMRNDVSRCCESGSVKVEKLFEVTSHATVHHMSSTVTGKLQEGCSTLDAIASCFPPGSMTGAPKVRAMQLCTEKEMLARGIYSGALGWLGGDGSADFSVVIRTIIMQEDRFEFQVGGGIVADSTPESEWRETMVKARGVAAALEIGMEELEKL